MFTVNEVQLADVLERVRHALIIQTQEDPIHNLFEDGYTFALDKVWEEMVGDDQPYWHYQEPEPEELHDVLFSKF